MELVTSTECISAGDYHVPPMIIFQGAYYLYKHFKNDISGDTLWARSDSGLLGVVGEGDYGFLPDYTKSKQQVFMKLTKFLI